MNPHLTTFEIETHPDIKVIKKYGDRVEKETFCVDMDEAREVRAYWVNEFWSWKLN